MIETFLLFLAFTGAAFLIYRNINKRDEKKRAESAEVTMELINQTKKQTKIMDSQLKSGKEQILLAQESTERMSELAETMQEFSNMMLDMKQDIEFIKGVMIDEETDEVNLEDEADE